MTWLATVSGCPGSLPSSLSPRGVAKPPAGGNALNEASLRPGQPQLHSRDLSPDPLAIEALL